MALTGVTEPRLSTPSLAELTPETTLGFEVIQFAATLGLELMPWQKLALVRGLELLPDGRPRFRTVVCAVSRQNGKTMVAHVLILWSMMTGRAKLVLGTSTNLEMARESWQHTVDLAEDRLAGEIAKNGIRRGAMDTSLTLRNKARYKVAAANRKGGRSLSVDLGIADELREHLDWDAWGAMSGATTARRNSQIWAFSNAGDDRSVVLNHLRDSAISYIETGEGDGSLCLLEWSAPDDADLESRSAWAQANPALGTTIDEETLVSKLNTSPPNVFRTEHMCIHVASMDSAIDTTAWKTLVDEATTLDDLRDRVACCLDVSLDLQHVSLVAAAVDDTGRVRVEVVEVWDGTAAALDDLPGLLEKVKPRTLGWLPGGPAAALATDLRGVRNAAEITGVEVAVVCQSFAEHVQARRVLHRGDPALSAQVAGASRLFSGDGWRFTRKGAGHVDCVYAAAGAVFLARNLPPPRPRPMIIVPKRPAA
jgi:hypothetical protein